MDITCYYQEVTPGVEDPQHDIFLGCDYIDFYGNEISSSGQPGWDVGVHGGAPNSNAPACSGAPEAVGDSFPYNGKLITIRDVNSLWQGSTNVGWLYLGSDGTRYIQANYATQTGINWAVSVGILSVGGSTPGGYSGIDKYSGTKPPGTRNVKCFTKGQSLG